MSVIMTPNNTSIYMRNPPVHLFLVDECFLLLNIELLKMFASLSFFRQISI